MCQTFSSRTCWPSAAGAPASSVAPAVSDVLLRKSRRETADTRVMLRSFRKGLTVRSDPKGADAVVDGTIKSFAFYGVLLDSRGRARIFEVTITAAVTVRDQVTNRVLYDNQNYVFRGEFEFTSDPRSFFNEEDPAVQRMARSFAESIVSTLVNGFGVNQEK